MKENLEFFGFLGSVDSVLVPLLPNKAAAFRFALHRTKRGKVENGGRCQSKSAGKERGQEELLPAT